MSSKFPLLSSQKIVTALERDGFARAGQKGSHLKMRKGDRVAIIPMHREVARGTLKSILEQARIDLESFLNLL